MTKAKKIGTMSLLEIVVSWAKLPPHLDPEQYGIEDQADYLIYEAMADAFKNDVDEISATTGWPDSVRLWDDDGNEIDPAGIDALHKIDEILARIDWTQIETTASPVAS